MSFRARLTLFFVLIVLVPMVAVAVVMFQLISDNETGKTDASVAAQQRAAINLYEGAVARNERVVDAIGRDQALADALQARDRAAARARARALLGDRGVDRIAIVSGSATAVDVGARDAVAPARRNLVGDDGRPFGRLEVSGETAAEFAARTTRLTEADVVVRLAGRTLASTFPGVRLPALPEGRGAGDVEVDGARFRASTTRVTSFLGERVAITVFEPDEERSGAINRAYVLAAGILLGFLVLALTFALTVSRSLQAQIAEFLRAARRLGGGDFSGDVPTVGGDEFAELGQEFNKMSRQLSSTIEDLQQERARLKTSLRRIGEAFGSNLDRDALLEIVVRTTVDGVAAQGGRAVVRPGPERELEERARAGELFGLTDAIEAAEAGALASGAEHVTGDDGLFALAHPLHGVDDEDEVVGVVSVARRSQPFSESERELFGYLAGQASVAVENVGLHEAVQRQAVTDELTGLFNHRRFQEAMESEAERAKRYGHGMGLVMLDIDNFKQVNDTYGHQQGDRVLAEVARILRESSREIDAPARYGGEELAVVLPQTDLEGAFNLAERVRTGIEDLRLPVDDDGGGTIRVTASLGVASMPDLATTPRELLSKADQALYAAKRSGKNRTVRAG